MSELDFPIAEFQKPYLCDGWLIIPDSPDYFPGAFQVAAAVVVGVELDSGDDLGEERQPATVVRLMDGHTTIAPVEWYETIRDLVIKGG